MRRAPLPALGLLGLLACGGDSAPEPVSTPTPVPGASASGCSPGADAPASLRLQRVANGLTQPVDIQSATGDRRRLYIVEQPGRIRVVRDGALVVEPFLDLAGRLSSGGERGLLGLAFHPGFAQNRRFFVNYTDRAGNTQIAEFKALDPDRADATSERTLLAVAQPFANHNGGGLRFGPEGKLYAGLGDGGSGGDPQGNGQNLQTLLGKLLRIDVDAASPYAVPADNPFVGRAGARPEIWALGLRNPWRFAFDATTGDLFIGDVGQSQREELDVALAPRRGGENYGWNVMEGTRCFAPSSGCATVGLTLPLVEYGHDQGCSVTAGAVYRGCRLPGLQGAFFYGDFCSGLVRSFRVDSGRAIELRDWTPGLTGLASVSTFGTDADGELYVADYDGEIYTFVAP